MNIFSTSAIIFMTVVLTLMYLIFLLIKCIMVKLLVLNSTFIGQRSKVKVGVLRPVQQPGSYWDRSSELPLVGLEPTEVTAYD